ncbi:MAG TPA: ABC transporter permease subunit [Candidatus Borkfalkia avicola]|mgnify:FL=1|uniref:ABC transporter permease subunit n=1 Tax=Candidatus Borkfalkia avicola TaxID=2838503 RepID=A0A9D2D780_9FIRM|nr:ABC transporter permease subunit [Candidatus Borkfalkia avicola]
MKATKLAGQTGLRQKNPLLRSIIKNRYIYLMLLPVVAFYVIFSYVPMYGVVLAWKDYRHTMGILGSPWVGWENFEVVFRNAGMVPAIRNTIVISLLKLVFCFPAPVILALLLNEVTSRIFKRSAQTIVYLPNFISWVIIGGLVKTMFAIDDGLVNNILEAMGIGRINFLLDSKYFYFLLIGSELWKSTGWGTVIYIAAISGIDPTLYEAAKIDGCKRFGLIRFITFPCILPIIAVMLIMQISNIMNAGFDSVYNLYNETVYDVADIIDTLVYRLGVTDGKYEQSTAVGLFKNVINFILLLTGNWLTKKMCGYSMYSLD